jgi:hypothetical protein
MNFPAPYYHATKAPMRCLVSVQRAKEPSSAALGWWVFVVAILFLVVAGARANETKSDATDIPTSGKPPESGGNAHLSSEGTNTAQPVSSVSPHTAALLAATRPKYDPPKTLAEQTNAIAENEQPEEDILHLPRMVVHGPRLPQPRDVMSMEGKMDQYLGPKTGFDRGLLNFYTFNWGNEVVSFSLFDAVKNESRARELFAEEERKRTSAQFQSVLSWEKLSASGSPDLKREIEKYNGAQKPLPGK